MPIVTVQMLEGKTHEQKVRLAKAITNSIAEICDVNKDVIQVIFADIPITEYVKGGSPATEWHGQRLNRDK
jgi:4-oxalocrotonate tautomerase